MPSEGAPVATAEALDDGKTGGAATSVAEDDTGGAAEGDGGGGGNDGSAKAVADKRFSGTMALIFGRVTNVGW